MDVSKKKSEKMLSSSQTFNRSKLKLVSESAVPLVASPANSPGNLIANWAADAAREMASFARNGPGGGAPTETKKVSSISLLNFSTTEERVLMVVGLVAAAVSGLSMPVWLLLLAKSLEVFNNIGIIVTNVGGEEAIEVLVGQLYQLCWSFAVVGAVSLFSGGLYVTLWTYTGEKQALRIRERFVRSAFRQDATWFDQRGDPQELPTLAANALTRINTAIGRQMADTVANFLSAVLCLCVSIALNKSLALIMLCFLPIIGICVAVISFFMRRKSGQALDEFASAGAFATEVVSGIKTVASLGAESWAASRYEGIVTRAEQYSIGSGFLTKLTAGVMGFLFYVAYTVAFIFGTEQVSDTEYERENRWSPFSCIFRYCGISGAEVMVCIYGVILCAQFFSLMSPGIQAINEGRQAAVEIFDAIYRDPGIDAYSDEKGTIPENFEGTLNFRKVVFAYPSRPSTVVFNNFNLRIPGGSSVALVGPSGSGKSTISKLLLRFYDPTAGSVLADGVPLTELNLKWWRSKIGYVPQEPSLFPGTLRDNIAMGKPGGLAASDEEVEAAAKAACAHDFIMELPDQYHTFYSGASIQLSGGQMQRIAIARAIIRDPAILILDEATSALDSQSEKWVQDALENIRRNRRITTVTVAHRLTTILHCDQIAVISQGAVQELGDHASLFGQGGIYTTLCKSQGITAESSRETVASSEESGGNDAKQSAEDIETGKLSEAETLAEEGSFLLEEKRGKGEAVEEELAPLSKLWEYNKGELGYMILGAIGAITVGAMPPVEGILFASLTANFFLLESKEMKNQNYGISCMFLVLAVVSLLGNMAMGYGFSVSGFRLTRRMRTLVFNRITRHGMGWFDFPQHSTGELTLRLEEDAEAVAKVTGWSLGQRIQVVSSLVTGLAISLAYSWRVGLVAIACVPIIMCAAFVQATFSKHTVVEQEGLSAATILERGLREIKLVQAYNLQESVSDQYRDALQPDAESKVKQGVVAGLVFGFSQCAVFSTFGILFYAGLQFMIQGKVGFVDFFVSLLAIMFAAIGLGQINADFESKRKGLAAAARIFALLDEDLDSDDPLSTSGAKPGSLDGRVSFEDVNFSYPTRPGHPVYYPSEGREGLSLTIESKESVAFVGKSGCGKSTALQLLLRFYGANSGQVMLDSNDVKGINISWLRGNIGYVGQQPVLFAGTIRENLLLGHKRATKKRILEACKAANAHDFIMNMSDGYETHIESGGGLLSGGQKQRIAIARAIIKNPRLLVLDEATSALDNRSEGIVQMALDEIQKESPRTTLVVAHRLMTIKNCDKIAVLGGGGVEEFGSHSELLEKQGLYYDLWMQQGGDKSTERTTGATII